VAARAIVAAAREHPREVFVGAPTVAAIEGTKLMPGIADRYLAETGFDSQMTEEPIRPDRIDNLFEPAPGNYEAHGRFPTDGKTISQTAWTSSFPSAAVLAGAMGLGMAGYLAARILHRA
jgi:hypothetical protein